MNRCELLSEHLLQLWKDEKMLDVLLFSNGQSVCSGHQVVLSAYSPVLMDILVKVEYVPSTKQQLKVCIRVKGKHIYGYSWV